MAEGIKAYQDASVVSIFQRSGPPIVSVSHDEGEPSRRHPTRRSGR